MVPELVPFRLTKNMVCAMGPMGYEGLFRRACELTLRLMRNEREVLVRCASHGLGYTPYVFI